MGILRRLDHQGDTEYVWDGEAEEARLIFDAHIKAGGMAFDVPADAREPAEVIRKFRPGAKEIILAPRMVGG